MFCDRCGTRLEPSQSYCPSCGKPVGTVPLMPVQSRVAGHVRLLGILWLAISAFRLIPGLFLLTMFRHGHSFMPPDVPYFVFGMMRMIGGLLLAGAVLGLVTAWGLLERQPWARMLAIVLGCFSLMDMPFGTALGIYTLWVLLPARSEEEYRQMSKVA
jgi:hypothetical protein